MMRLVLSGAFDAFPRLKVILGHYGEGLPFQLQRVDHAFTRPHIKADGAAVPDLMHPPSYYLRTNMWVSTSGNYLPAAFVCTRDALGIDRIVLGTDHPYEEMKEASPSCATSAWTTARPRSCISGTAPRWAWRPRTAPLDSRRMRQEDDRIVEVVSVMRTSALWRGSRPAAVTGSFG